MKICMVGLGSIGQRHLKNLNHVLSKRGLQYSIDALRMKGGELSIESESKITNTYRSLEELPDDYDVIFITNPTIFHFEMVTYLIRKTKNMFVEKPVFEQYKEIENLKLSDESTYYVACPLRHKKVIKYIKMLVDKGEKFNSIRVISSSYLPDWRKGTDYRDVYSAKKNLGGGVELDLIHEWDYISYLFGKPDKMFKLVGRYSDLEIDSDDIAVYIARYVDKVLEVHLDYFGIENVRVLELIGNGKKYIVDINRDQIRFIEKNTAERLINFGPDDPYISEMEYFFDLIQERKKSFNEIDKANALLRFVLEGYN